MDGIILDNCRPNNVLTYAIKNQRKARNAQGTNPNAFRWFFMA